MISRISCLIWRLWWNQEITEVQYLNNWERLHELKLYSLQRHGERYIIIYIWKIIQHMVPNIDGTIGHTIKTRNHPRHETQCVIQYPTKRNPAQSLQENAITVLCMPRLYNSLSKYLRDIESVKIQILALLVSRHHSSSAQNAQQCHRIRKQQHPRPAHSSDGSRNLPQWWSPRLGHGEVLAASNPLQLSK